MTTAIEESQKLRQAIVSESPTLNALLALVATRMNASSSAAEQRNFEAAISSYQHSLSELEAHSDMDRSTAILAKRAELTHLLGTAYSGKGDDRSAIESFQKAIELREELVARNTVAGYQMDLAKSYSDLSVLRRRANQPEEATKDAEHSLELCKTVARIFPNSPEYQLQYAECLYRTAATVTGNQVLERLQLSESILQKIVDNREVRVQSGLLLGTVLDGTAK